MPTFEELTEKVRDKYAGHLMRRRAIVQLAELGDLRAVPCLVEALSDSASSVRREAARCLGRFGTPNTVPALCRALDDDDQVTRQHAVESLGRIGAASARAVLDRALQDRSLLVRRAAETAIEKMEARPQPSAPERTVQEPPVDLAPVQEQAAPSDDEGSAPEETPHEPDLTPDTGCVVGEPPEVVERSSTVVNVGGLSIVFGVLGFALWLRPASRIWAPLQRLAGGTYEFEPSGGAALAGLTVLWACVLAFGVLSLCLMLMGVGVVLVKEWARRLAGPLALAMVAATLASFVSVAALSVYLERAFTVNLATGCVLGLAILLGLAWPVAMGLTLKRESVRAEFARSAGAYGLGSLFGRSTAVAVAAAVAIAASTVSVHRRAKAMIFGDAKRGQRPSKWALRMPLTHVLRTSLRGDAPYRVDDEPIREFFRLFASKSPGVRATAVAGLLRVRRPRAQSLLTQALNSSNAGIRCTAVYGLGALIRGPWSAAGREAISEFRRALRDEDAVVKQNAAAALARFNLGCRGISELLVEAVESESTLDRAAPAFALAEMTDKRAGPALLTVLRVGDAAAKRAAAKMLGWLGETQAVGPLQDAVRTRDRGCRLEAIEALGEIGDVSAVPTLKEVLQDSDGNVRQEAAVALARIGSVDAQAALKGALEKPEIRHRLMAQGQLRDRLREDGPIAVATNAAGDRLAVLGFHSPWPNKRPLSYSPLAMLTCQLVSPRPYRIWARPHTNGRRTPSYRPRVSHASWRPFCNLHIAFGGQATVDEVRFEVMDGERKHLLSLAVPIQAEWCASAPRPRSGRPSSPRKGRASGRTEEVRSLSIPTRATRKTP